MNLPNFHKHPSLNELRRRMAAELVELVPIDRRSNRVSRKDLERLRTTGITVNLDEIEYLEGGVFSFRGVPVLLYIYSPTFWTEEDVRLPKFHLCNCPTWNDMKARGRQDRYVASTRIDGLFELDVYISSLDSSRKSIDALKVCQRCLHQLHWKGFRNGDHSTQSARMKQVESFSLDEFFQHYARPMIREKPRWTPETIPSGSYTDDFEEISSRARAVARWRCQDPTCGRLFAQSWQRRYLHVHHRNGVKGDNSPENLIVLCLGCHAKQPSHEQLKNGRDYIEFVRLFGLSRSHDHGTFTTRMRA